MEPRRRYPGPAPRRPLHGGVHPNPTQTPRECCPHRGPATSATPESRTHCPCPQLLSDSAVPCSSGKFPGASHNVQARSHLSSHFPVCPGQYPSAWGPLRPPWAPLDPMQSSPGDALANPGFWQAPIEGSTPLHPTRARLCRVSLRGKEERGPQPSPPATEEMGRGQAVPPSPEEQEQSCPSPCTPAHPPS